MNCRTWGRSGRSSSAAVRRSLGCSDASSKASNRRARKLVTRAKAGRAGNRQAQPTRRIGFLPRPARRGDFGPRRAFFSGVRSCFLLVQGSSKKQDLTPCIVSGITISTTHSACVRAALPLLYTERTFITTRISANSALYSSDRFMDVGRRIRSGA